MTRYLITGAAGFIGSHLSELLLGQGSEVYAIDNLSTGRMDNIAHLMGNANFHFARATINDQVVMDQMASQSDTIIHLAAAVGVKLIVEHPVHTIETNITGTESVLKSALRYGNKVLVASTSEVYGKGNRIPFTEDDDVVLGATTKSRWAYAASKMVDEFLALAYQREYELDVTIFRLFNTVGPRQTGQYGMVVPRLIQQALKGERITVYGDGQQSRCFCDVRDVVEALVRLAKSSEASGKVVNIGNTEEISIQGLAERVKTLTASASEIVYVPYSEAYAPGFEDMRRRVPDTARIESLVGWKPQRNLDNILESIIAFERDKQQPQPTN